MDIHLSDEAARYLEARLRRDGYHSPSEFLEDVLRNLRFREAQPVNGQEPWLRARSQSQRLSGTTTLTPAMTPYEPGCVVLVRFPFSNLQSAKKRPALVVSPAAYALRYSDLVVLALTSQPQPEPFLGLEHWQVAGLLGPTWIKPALFCIHTSLIDRPIGTLAGDDAAHVAQALALLLAEEFLPGR